MRDRTNDPVIIALDFESARGAAGDDQKRVATPAEAVNNGADYVVVGREVTRSADPPAALAAIHAGLGALVSR